VKKQYIHRELERKFKEVVLVTGARQVGKSTMLKGFASVSLDVTEGVPWLLL